MLLRYYIVFALFPSSILARICTIYELKNGRRFAIKTCCKGYSKATNSGNLIKCVPVCDEDCGMGTCINPQTCSCNTGYENFGHNVANGCVPACKGGCQNGECVAPEMCNCHDGYKLDESTGRCVPFCSSGCFNGHCAAPGKCNCHEGYRQVEVSETDSGCLPVCDVACGMNRTCVTPNKCGCSEGYVDFNNSCWLPEELSNGRLIESSEGTNDNVFFTFMRRWMIEFIVGLVAVTLMLIMGISICNCRRKNNVVRKHKVHHPSMWESEVVEL